MKIIYLLPMFSVSLLAHPNNIIHYHNAEYLIYAIVAIITLNVLRIFLRRFI